MEYDAVLLNRAWIAGYEHGAEDEHASEHGKSPYSFKHGEDCPRCVAGKDTEAFWTTLPRREFSRCDGEGI